MKRSARPAFFTSGPRAGSHGPPRFVIPTSTPIPAATGPSTRGPFAKDKRLKEVDEAVEVLLLRMRILAQASSSEGNARPMLRFLCHRAQMVKPLLTGSALPMPLLPMTSWCKKVGGRVPRGVTMVTPSLTYQSSSSERYNPSELRRGWRTWRMTPC